MPEDHNDDPAFQPGGLFGDPLPEPEPEPPPEPWLARPVDRDLQARFLTAILSGTAIKLRTAADPEQEINDVAAIWAMRGFSPDWIKSTLPDLIPMKPEDVKAWQDARLNEMVAFQSEAEAKGNKAYTDAIRAGASPVKALRAAAFAAASTILGGVPKVELLSVADAIAALAPPEYLIHGMLARNYVYSLTAATGAGKTSVLILLALAVATGKPFAGRPTKPGRVLYLVGENPDDTLPRFQVAAVAQGLTLADLPITVATVRFDLRDADRIIGNQAKALGDFQLVVVDTGPAFLAAQGGAEENSNDVMITFAHTLRALKDTAPGNPTLIAAMHPSKSANEKEHLVPRGGSAFLNEVDGNLTLYTTDGGKTSSLHWAGKFRGAHFEPVPFQTVQTSKGGVLDADGNPMMSVYAKSLTFDQAEKLEAITNKIRDDVLQAIIAAGEAGIGPTAIALKLKLLDQIGVPKKQMVNNHIKALMVDKLVEKAASAGKTRATAKGKKLSKAEPKFHWSDLDDDDGNTSGNADGRTGSWGEPF